MTADVALENVTVRYGGFAAATNIDLRIAPGEFFSFLGPSGCGKTTLLRAISGFVEPSDGVVRIGGRDMRGIGPNRRPTALIFQSLALFPTMTVAENIGYGLRVRGIGGGERRRRVEALLDLVALAEHGDKRVDALSGGQRQRVAIARALAVEPQVLLLDEPLSALDLKLRQHMRRELRALQRRVGLTFVYITHDQGEALTMSDRVAVMNRGRIEQVGSGPEVYEHPRTAFVAGFVGETNAIAGRVTSVAEAGVAEGQGQLDTAFRVLTARNPRKLAPGAAAILFVRPASLLPDARENLLPVRAGEAAYEGSLTHQSLQAGSQTLIATLPRPLPQGTALQVGFAADDAVILPPEG